MNYEEDFQEEKEYNARLKNMFDTFLENRKTQKFSGELNSLILQKSREFCGRLGITLNMFYEHCIIHEFQRIYNNNLIFNPNTDKEIIDYLKQIRISEKSLDNRFKKLYTEFDTITLLKPKQEYISKIVHKEFSELPLKDRKILINCLCNSDVFIEELLIKD